jgi:hypothetical protein
MHWCWAFCRKLNRFKDKDVDDILALLPHLNYSGFSTATGGNSEASAEKLWAWIEKSCPAQIKHWQERRLEETIRERILDVTSTFVPE